MVWALSSLYLENVVAEVRDEPYSKRLIFSLVSLYNPYIISFIRSFDHDSDDPSRVTPCRATP